jgi:hypothetical protein
MQKSARLLEASTSSVPSPFSSPDPFLTSNERIPSLAPLVVGEPSYEGFDIAWHKKKEEIGEYNGDFFYSQKTNLCASNSRCEELDEDDFHEGDYAIDEFKSLEDLWWPKECLRNVEKIYKKKTPKGVGKEKKEEGCGFCNGRWERQGGSPYFPTSTSP